MITIFKNVLETSSPYYRSHKMAIDRIKNGASFEKVKAVRHAADKEEKDKLKMRLPAICFSGKFSGRTDSSIVEHSGLICLDFDGYETTADMMVAKIKLGFDKFAYCVFVSPSGLGLKVLVKVPPVIENHIGYFLALKEHFNDPHFDTTSRNLSRVCYESYDPSLLIREDSLLWDKVFVPKEEKIHQAPKGAYITDENKIVEILLKWWGKKYGMVSGMRNHNLYILAISLNEFGINKTYASTVLLQFEQPDFKQAEIMMLLDSAYSKVDKFGTKQYDIN